MFGGNSQTDENKYYNVAALITFHHGILCMREILITTHQTMRLKCQKRCLKSTMGNEEIQGIQNLAPLNKWNFRTKRVGK